jgi:hypothetical protein
LQAERKRLRDIAEGFGGSSCSGGADGAEGDVGGSDGVVVGTDGAEGDDDDGDDDEIAGDTGGSYREPFKWAGDLHM